MPEDQHLADSWLELQKGVKVKSSLWGQGFGAALLCQVESDNTKERRVAAQCANARDAARPPLDPGGLGESFALSKVLEPSLSERRDPFAPGPPSQLTSVSRQGYQMRGDEAEEAVDRKRSDLANYEERHGDDQWRMMSEATLI